MATLRKKKTKKGYIWEVDFYLNGKRYRKSTKTGDRKLAELFLKDIEVRIAKGEFAFNEIRGKKISLDEFINKYIEFSRATKAENTFLLDRHSLTVLKNRIGNMLLNNISYRDVEDFKVNRSKEVKPASVNLEIRHLKAAFEVAKKWEYIKENPFRELKQIKVKGKNLPKYLSKSEVTMLLEAIPEGLFKCLVEFYLYTGCRRNEALNLAWDNIDLKNERIILVNTKSGNDRLIPINSSLMRVLKSMDTKTKRPFPFKPRYVTQKVKDYLKASGIKRWKEFTVHSLRHTFASHLVMEGSDLYTVSKLLGHSSVAVTQMYAHLAPDYLKVSVERLRF